LSGPTIFGSNGNELFTNENPAKVALASGNIQTTPSGKQDVKVVDPLPAGTNSIGAVNLKAPTNGAEMTISQTATSNDATSETIPALYTVGYNQLFNGSKWDRQRSNTEGALIASGSRTASTSTAIQTNHNGRGVILALDVTAVPVSAETLTIEVKMSISGQASQAIAVYSIPNTVGKYFLMVAPGLVEKDGTTLKIKQVSASLPRSWYTVITHSASSSWTYSLNQALTV